MFNIVDIKGQHKDKIHFLIMIQDTLKAFDDFKNEQ